MDSKAGSVGVTRGDLKTIFEHYITADSVGARRIEPELIEAVQIFAGAGWYKEIASVFRDGFGDIKSAELLHAFAGAFRDAEARIIPIDYFHVLCSLRGKSRNSTQGINPKDWRKAAKLLPLPQDNFLVGIIMNAGSVPKEDRKWYMAKLERARRKNPLCSAMHGLFGQSTGDRDSRMKPSGGFLKRMRRKLGGVMKRKMGIARQAHTK